MRIDAHQHFWALARGDYGWLTPELGPIYRDFAPDDLLPLLKAAKIEGTVLVQAAPTVAETEYMLSLADQNAFIKGVVGWVDFEAADAPARIAELAAHPALVGLRPMIQDIADPLWMLGDKLAPAFEAVQHHDLTFDALTLPQHLGPLRTLLERQPNMRVVIDHGSKPLIKDAIISDWADNMAALAKETAAWCKLSGLLTEAAADWSVEDLRPYVDHLLNTFGPSRLIWGSDWPVCTLASSYERWLETTDVLLNQLSDSEREAILGGNAARAYNLRE
ncbi:putative metal-dependent hydrolase of the TIM-barrel fold protein [Ruegeria sp. THAF57]|uniref:amidohydrolase family protein n=1 Tax=Ruegeria sp. THAF57 TaxID=2744555 RepID=UPI0015DE8113|nr:amidohydrolase family protein [Ruegeria sp. THAF57]CAD0186870.1 putative metal-dependent hydrolase of the TIM-barrel fold protein [Ruegeria sp. THAF57]